jgi:hypothetical protein
MKAWLQSLQTALAPLTPLQRRIALVLTILVAASRFMALARSLWDWDEALFSFALRDYDVAAHHPHPPGFPLFIFFAKGVHLFVASEFRSLQAIAMLGAIALFPLMLLLGRELRMPFATNVIAALLLAFAPNVWVFGGSAFSDVPSLALSLLAVALLMRGCRSTGWYLAGALVLAIAVGFRPQNLIIGMMPSLLATWYRIRATRSPLPLVLAILIGAGGIAAAFAGAVKATGSWERYREAVKAHQHYITSVDSYKAPARPPLWQLLDDFFLRPYRMERLNIATSILSALGVLGALFGRRPRMLMTLAIFGPFSIFGWLMLDLNSVSRFAIAWMPMISIATAEGLSILGALLRQERRALFVELAGAAFLAGTMFTWTMPALRVIRRQKSPPVQTIEWIHDNLPKTTTVFVHGSMGPHADLLLGDYPTQYFDDDPMPPLDGRKPWVLREGASGSKGAKVFSYPHDRLFQIVRQRYFEVTVAPVLGQIEFGEGWYGEESLATETFRWMGGRGVARLQPLPPKGRLTLAGYIPLDVIQPPTITITFNGTVIGRFVAKESNFSRTYDLESRADWNDLVLETSEFVNPKQRGIGGDPRNLGIRIDDLDWAVPD